MCCLLVLVAPKLLDPSPSLSEFAAVPAPSAPTSEPPGTTPQEEVAVASTVEVVSYGCHGAAFAVGAGWPVNGNHVVTAAHVVAGANAVEVVTPAGVRRLATVVYIDDSADVALLYVADATFSPLHLAPSTSAWELPGPVIAVGYPNNSEAVGAGALGGTTTITSPWPPPSTSRELGIIQSPDIVQGFSGGPVVEPTGAVIGIDIEGLSTEPDDSFAVRQSALEPALADSALTQPVSTGGCGP